jgi:hypothetical protein
MITRKQINRFKRLCKGLNDLMAEIRCDEDTADAQYFARCSSLELCESPLLLEDTLGGEHHCRPGGVLHDDDVVVASVTIRTMDGGDP